LLDACNFSLKEVLNALANDYQFLAQESVLSECLIQEWIQAKRQEILDVEARPHPYEVQLYYDL
jgi:glutamine synthetase